MMQEDGYEMCLGKDLEEGIPKISLKRWRETRENVH